VAVTVGTISAAEQAAFAAGKPLWVGINAARSYLTSAEWSSARTWATGGSGGGTNLTNSSAPPRWAWDDRLGARTRPTSALVSALYLLFDFDDAAVDAVVLANHNFADIAGCEVRVGVADDSAFATNRRVIAEWTSFNGARLVALDLTDGGAHGAGEYRRFTGVRYAYLEIVTSGVFGVVPVPRVGEVCLGRRRQLARAHDYPSDDRALVSRVDEYEAEGGATARLVRYAGRREFEATWTADELDALGLDDMATWRSLYSDLGQGVRPAWYIRDPSTPSDAPFVLLDPVQRFDHQGPHHAGRTVQARELPPFVSGEA